MKHKIGIWTLCIVLLGALGIWFFSNQSDKSSDTDIISIPSSSPTVAIETSSPTPSTLPTPTATSEHSQHSSTPTIEVPQVTQHVEEAAPIFQPEKEVSHIEAPITKPSATPKPTEPPKPKPKETDKPQSSSKPPSYEEKETEPNKSIPEPNAGDKNENGKVYFPGFGWIEQGEANQGSKSDSDGDWNKQVGIMD
jgi:outer membrane biosynthesis protein TonB